VHELIRARELGRQESGLAVAITTRRDGSPRASVVNAGVVAHPSSDRPTVAFVSRHAARKLADLRRDPRATVVFRSGWEWVAVEGEVEIAGPRDHLPGLDEGDLLPLIRRIYAAAAGGEADQWAHTAVLLNPTRVYPEPAD
jgi:hypothetical protein